MTSSIIVHGLAVSGHSHRVECLLGMLGVPYRRVDAPAAVRATPEFRALNPLGQISLAPYPHVRGWIARVEALPGFRPMPVTALPEPVA